MTSKSPSSSRQEKLKEAQTKATEALVQLRALKEKKGSKIKEDVQSGVVELPQENELNVEFSSPAMDEISSRLQNDDPYGYPDLLSIEKEQEPDVGVNEPEVILDHLEKGRAEESEIERGEYSRSEEVALFFEREDTMDESVDPVSDEEIRSVIDHLYSYEKADEELTDQIVDVSDQDFEDMSVEDLDFDQMPLDIALPSSEEEGIVIKDNIAADEELLSIVLEEFEELVPKIELLLNRLFAGDESVIHELHRDVHTFKGSLAMVGAERGKTLAHAMENWMQKAELKEVDVGEGHEQLWTLFEKAKERVEALRRGDHKVVALQEVVGAGVGKNLPTPQQVVPQQRFVRLKSEDMDYFITEINESRLANASLLNNNVVSRQTMMELEDKSLTLAKMLREIEIHAESQIQSRRNEIEERGEEFDPLEMDKYTRFQELSRFLNEIATDISGIHRDLVRQVSDQETTVAYQSRAIESVRDGLQRARLILAESIGDRLHLLVKQTSRKVEKQVSFFMKGGTQPLDRSLLEKIIEPLEHILRNALTHGIESPEERRKLKKPPVGSVEIAVSQETGRVRFNIQDDGRGLDPEKIKAKAVQKGLWAPQTPMSMNEAADMICSHGFSTAETVNDLAGRGVGMDVVRNRIMTMGGRFEIRSVTGKGMEIDIVLPTSISSMSVVMVKSAEETWCVPAEIVEHMDRLSAKQWVEIKEEPHLSLTLGDETLQLRHRQLGQLMGLGVSENDPGSLLVLKAGDQRVAVLVDQLVGVAELPMRSLSRQWSSVPGVMGASVLPDGRASFLVDPLRADWAHKTEGQIPVHQRSRPIVLVVDDSITVRKVTSRFLEKQGYEVILAKDGQEAIELLVDMTPNVVLLDVEMPRMDGFDCARHIRENPKFPNLPIIMITSRTAEKHRKRALSMGVNEYLGKPFKEEEVLEFLEKYAPLPIQ